jgi:uncharacterized protein YdaU (DUF1376 family)
MSKDLGPFIPLYYGDFIGGTMSFGADEVGAYLLLICYQWQNGHIENDPQSIERIARCEYGKLRRVLAKFKSDGNGGLLNERCEEIRQERGRYMEAKRRAGEMGAEKRWGSNGIPNSIPTAQPMVEPCISSSSSSSSSPSSSLSKKTTTTPPEGGCGGFEIGKNAKMPEIIDALIACRPEYARIARSRWEEQFKIKGATLKHHIEAANVFIKQDANGIDALKAPANYYGGILKKLLEKSGVITETQEERIERIRRSK